MKTKKTASLFFLSLAMLMFIAVNASSAEKANLESREYDYGIAAGIWLGGTIDQDDLELDKDPGPLFKVFADMYVAPKFAVGAYGSYSTTTLSYAGIEADATMWELGVTMKAKFLASPDLAIKPGLGIGYRSADRDKLYAGENTSVDGLAVNMSLEFQFPIQGGYILFAETGFLSQPTGGNSDADVTWAPIFYLMAGIAF